MGPEQKGTIDPVDPAHYKAGNIQVWDFIVDQGLDFLEGNVVKYVCRWRKKDGIKDLMKAKAYIEKLIEINEPGALDILLSAVPRDLATIEKQ